MKFGDLLLTLIFPDKEYTKWMSPITSTGAIDSREIDEQGLYSTSIFGPLGSESRMNTFAYIDLYVPLIHPKIYQMLVKANSLYKGILAGTRYAIFDKKRGDYIPSTQDDKNASTGYTFFMFNINDLKIDKESAAGEFDNIQSVFNKYRKKGTLTNTKLLVLPAGMRDINIEDDNRVVEDELNEYYKKVISAAAMLETERRYNKSIDYLIFNLQTKIDDLYSAITELLKGKKKFIGGHVTGRNVDYGTRNILSGKQTIIEDLYSDDMDSLNLTIMGLYQFIKAAEPFVKHHVTKTIISHLFNTADYTAKLFNPKTKRIELVKLPNDEVERFTTSKGLTTLFNRIQDSYVRNTEIPIKNYGLCPVYDDGNTVTIYLDDSKIDDSIRGKLRSITYGEFVYVSIYRFIKDVVTTNTRYPIAEAGGVFVSNVDVSTTTENRDIECKILSEIDGVEYPIEKYPNLNSDWNDSVSVSYTRLKGMGADMDGDAITNIIIYTEEAVREAKEFMKSKRNLISPSGEFIPEIMDYIVDITIKTMTKKIMI